MSWSWPGGPPRPVVLFVGDDDLLGMLGGGIESHGTGTALGDPVEVGALARFGRGVFVRGTKASTGHLEPAAASAGRG